MSSVEKIQQAIRALEEQRVLLGDNAVDTAVASLRQQLNETGKDSSEVINETAERKLVTILFADISGFTSMSEKSDPEEIRTLMNKCFDTLVPVIIKYNGTVDKFIGDEVMALFGAPKADEKHAELACHAALEMMDVLKPFNTANGVNLGLHIGINTGLVVAGGIGSEKRQQYSVMGDAVNLGARLCAAAANGEIYVGTEVYNIVSHLFTLKKLPAISLKGKALPVRVYSLKSKKRSLRKRKTGFTSPLIGRDKELQILNSAISSLKENKGSVVSIIGEAGIGKSRLLKESHLLFQDKAKWFEGRALSHLMQISYVPAKEILRKMISEKSEESETALKAALKQQLIRLTAVQAEELFPFLLTLLELSITEEESIVVRYLNALSLRERIQNAFLQFVQLHLRHRLLVFVWEDIHWADDETLQLLYRLFALSDEKPLVNILLFRPQKNAAIWDFHEKSVAAGNNTYKYIELEPLTRNENNELISNLAKIKMATPEIEQLVFDKSGGNPFYIEEILRTLLIQGIINVKAEQIHYNRSVDHLKLPNTLQGIIASRVDQLGAESKLLLQTASVLGRIFSKNMLHRLISVVNREINVEAAIEKLLDNEMLRIKDGADSKKTEFIFKHAITQEVAYNTMLIAHRKEIHNHAAVVIHDLYGDQQSFDIAYHFEKADRHKEALQHYKIAAINAETAFAYENALTFYFKAIEQARHLLRTSNESIWKEHLTTLYERVGDIYRLQTRREEALDNYENALLFEKDLLWISRARILRKKSLCYELIRESSVNEVKILQKKAQQLLEREKSKAPEWWSEWLELKFDVCWSLYLHATTDDLQKLLDEIKLPVELHASNLQKTRYLTSLILLNLKASSYQLTENAIVIARQAVELGASIKDLHVRLLTRIELAFVYLWANKIDLAIHHFEDFLPEAELIGDKVISSRGMIYLMVAYRRNGNVEKTQALIDEFLTTGKYARIAQYDSFISANTTWICWKKRQLNEIESNYILTIEKWSPMIPFSFLYAMPMLAYVYEMKDINRCIEFIKAMSLPHQKKLEPDLASEMQQVQDNFNKQNFEAASAGIEVIINLAEQYKYL